MRAWKIPCLAPAGCTTRPLPPLDLLPSAADPAFAKSLRRSGVSEGPYVRSDAPTPQLEAPPVTEKIVATALLLSDAAKIDLLGFDRREQCRPSDPSCAPSGSQSGKSSEGTHSALLAAKPGDRIGPGREKFGFRAVASVVARHGPRPGAEARKLGRSNSPDDRATKTDFERLLRILPIAIEKKDGT